MDERDVLALKEKYYVRNYITMLFEGFFVYFAMNMFSYTTVFPVYIQSLTNNSFFIALIAVVYYGCSYGSSIFSCLVGMNAKSPKWTNIGICALERIGFLFIVISTFFVDGSENLAIGTFFFSFAVYAITCGMASPVFGNMIGNLFPRDLGKFYGSYSLVGAAAGVIGSRIMTYLLDTYAFPINYRYVFILGLIAALIGSLVPAIGVKEVVNNKKRERIYTKELPSLVKSIFKTNIPYRRFVLLRILLGAAEMAIPFYIVKVSQIDGISPGFVGTMTTVLLISNMIASKIMGYIGDKFGPIGMIIVASLSGICAAILAIFLPHYIFSYLLFVLVAFAQQGVVLSNNMAGILYAKKQNLIPVMIAAMGLAVAPSYILFSFAGGAIANILPINYIFIIALCVYSLVAFLGIRIIKK